MDFAEYLQQHGYKVECLCDGMYLARNQTFCLLWSEHSWATNIAVRECFDRWANSTDWVYNDVPQTLQAMDYLINAIQQQYQMKNYNTEFGQRIEIPYPKERGTHEPTT